MKILRLNELKFKMNQDDFFDLFSDDVRVEVKLMASKEHYLKYISDIKSVVESIRAN